MVLATQAFDVAQELGDVLQDQSLLARDIAGSSCAVAGTVSSVRPPWLDKTTPSAPSSMARRASAGCVMPLSSRGKWVWLRSQATSSQSGARGRS